MSTSKQASRRILRDMAASQAPDAISWAHILLRHTANITDEAEQHKFWNWMQNPGDSDLPETSSWGATPEPQDIGTQVTVSVSNDEEKTSELTLQNTFKQNGMATYVFTEPKTSHQTSVPSQSRLECEDALDEKTCL